MKSLILALGILPLLLLCPNLSAGGNPHDSLLFDGTNMLPFTAECRVTVRYISGIGEGTVYHQEVIMICDVQDTLEEYKKQQVKINDELKPGSEITTGPGSFMTIEFDDGSEIRMGPNSKIVVSKDWCKDYGISGVIGDIWYNVKHLLGKNKYEVQTERCTFSHRGTQYSVSTTAEGGDTTVTVKVYEGGIDIMMNKLELTETDKSGKEMEQLNKDLQDKKISQDEFNTKLTELILRLNSSGENSQKVSVSVDAGYMCKVTKRLGDVVPIGSGDDKWFEGSNFPNK
jgi:hypothetical protein